jgi:hypothetical protein
MLVGDGLQPRDRPVGDLPQHGDGVGTLGQEPPVHPPVDPPLEAGLRAQAVEVLRLVGYGQAPQRVRVPDLFSQQQGRLELLVARPGLTPFERGAELLPAVEHPAAAGGRRAEAEDDGLGVVEDVQPAAAVAGLDNGAKDIEDGLPTPGVGAGTPPAEEPVAQGDSLFLLPPGLGCQHGLDEPRQPGQLGALGSLQLPGGVDSLLQQALLGLVPRLELVGPGLEPQLQPLEILAGEDEGFGGHAVFDGVELRAVFSFEGARTGALLGVAAVDLGPAGPGCSCCGGRGHGVGPLARLRHVWLPVGCCHKAALPDDPHMGVSSCINFLACQGFWGRRGRIGSPTRD